MRFYSQQHPYYCGIDLHTKNMYICILDQAGNIVVHNNINTSPQALKEVVNSYLTDMALAIEHRFTYY